MITKDPLPHLVEGWAITLQMRGEDADADHVAELAARGGQDGVQVGEELLGFRLSGVRELPRLRIGSEECRYEDPLCAGAPSVSIVRMWIPPRLSSAAHRLKRSHASLPV